MKNDSKALSSLDEILDLIWREEGRLAIINQYGTYLSDEEKTLATQLLTGQKANMDRLFTIYRDELLPLIQDVFKKSDAMNPLFDKLLASTMIAKQMNGEKNVTEQTVVIDAVRSEEAAMEAGTALVNNDEITASGENAEVPLNATGGEVAPAQETASVVAESTEEPLNAGGDVTGVADEAAATAVGEETVGGSQFNLGESATNTEVVGTDLASGSSFAEESAVAAENPLGSGLSETADSAVAASGDGSEGGSANEAVLSDVNEESSTPFVLSPIDEDVAPAVSEEEAKKAEETIAAADQQLGAIESVKTDIVQSTELTEEEKTEKLAQYTRISDVAVKAILVTKAQCEKLLASRVSQKALLKPTETEVSTEVSDGVVALPDLTASEGETVVALPPVESVTADTNNAETGVVIPAIGGEASTTETPAAEIPAVENSGAAANGSEVSASDLVLEIPGAVSTETPVENAQNDLQSMIEQANTLYKEGKVAEAQALFEKIGAMNKDNQGGSASEVTEDAAVLVKK